MDIPDGYRTISVVIDTEQSTADDVTNLALAGYNIQDLLIQNGYKVIHWRNSPTYSADMPSD